MTSPVPSWRKFVPKEDEEFILVQRDVYRNRYLAQLTQEIGWNAIIRKGRRRKLIFVLSRVLFKNLSSFSFAVT